MGKKHRIFYSMIIISALAVVCFVAVLYVIKLNQTISENIIDSISEMAEHDKNTIQNYIEICWDDLWEISERLEGAECKTIADVQDRMELECGSSGFHHLYLLAEDGTVYSHDHMTYDAGSEIVSRTLDFRPYFAGGKEKVFAQMHDKDEGAGLTKESILYGYQLHGMEVGGTEMFALIGTSEISSIQDNIVIDSFIKDGVSRGHSALIDMDGDYIIDVNKKIYLNKSDNLYEHLSESEDSELSNEEVAKRLENRETFGFYHAHAGDKNKELYYFIPFEHDMDLYFALAVNEAVFREQTNTFVTMSMTMLVVCTVIVIAMLLIVMVYQNRTIRTQEKARSQKEFLSNMSHEIRTPLNGLIGVNHLIMAHIDDDAQRGQIKEWLKKSQSTANYLLSLVNDILDLSKLQAGKVDLVSEPLLIGDIIGDISAMQAENIRSRGIEFIIEQEIGWPCIEGDATRIKQILMNIVGNAAKFTLSGGYIKLSVSQERMEETQVMTTYRCEDSGIGMSKEYLTKIFDSFSQEQSKAAEGIKGTGLGMTISKLLTNAMGGTIAVESELDVGSTFTVAIPARIVEDVPDYLKSGSGETAEDAEAPEERGERKPVKVLVAEDVELNAEVLLEILSLEGFETAYAKNGREAIELFRQSEPGEFDVILMDMKMPVMDGCAAAKEIRNMDREDANKIPIFACTANTFQEDRDQAIESGMDDFLMKPIDIPILLKKLGRI